MSIGWRGRTAALPVTALASTRGGEVCFRIPVSAAPAPDARQVLASGTICFRVEGAASALPRGLTPVSEGNECRLVRAVNIIGSVDGEPAQLTAMPEGAQITMRRAE
jgi:uncharacterized protein